MFVKRIKEDEMSIGNLSVDVRKEQQRGSRSKPELVKCA